MFYSITGNVVYFDNSFVALDCNGVAFKCFCSMNTLKNVAKKGEIVTLYTHLSVKEDALDLFGFSNLQELECFKMLIEISGIGPKVAIGILSEFTPDKLALCIASGDTKSLSAAKGLGKKTAERLVVELKDKLAKGLDLGSMGIEIEAASMAALSSNSSEAVAALTSLGFTQSQASVAVGKLDQSLSVQEMITAVLKQMGKKG